jgi:hypothetical protein
MLPLVWSAFLTSTPSLKQHLVYRGPEQHRQHAIPAPQVRDRYRCHREWMTRPPAVMSS